MRRLTLTLTACLVAAGTAGVVATPSTAADRTPASAHRAHGAARPAEHSAAHHAALKLRLPSHARWFSYRGRVFPETQPSFVTGKEKFVLRSRRASYDKPIVTKWWHHGRWVTLPQGVMKDFTGLHNFLRIKVVDSDGIVIRDLRQSMCLTGGTDTGGIRIHPDAPARSPYPDGCPYNPYTIGSVMGLQAGWLTPIYSFGQPFRLEPGKYTVTTMIGPRYRRMFHLPYRTSHATTAVTVVKEGGGCGEAVAAGCFGRRTSQGRALQAGPRLVADHGGVQSGPKPDLRALPAWGIGVTHGGNHLYFSATVWNGGTSPMVVDGFRHHGKKLMDAYQYFFDKAGHQTGYQKIGHMVWDPRPSHHHWHFEDFAQYRLVSKNGKLIRRSHKEAFCLANTDPVDYTLPNAAWHPENTDLSTACGDLHSPAVREELSVGNGDTYTQIRAGQSFNLKGLPNGVYYVEIKANPDHRLLETNTHNNISMRKVKIGGTPGHRTVKVHKVGIVNEDFSAFRYFGGFGIG